MLAEGKTVDLHACGVKWRVALAATEIRSFAIGPVI
jgi:hypothetical protein